MSSNQSLTHAWYLKYDYYTLTEPEFLSQTSEIFRNLSPPIRYLSSLEIPSTSSQLSCANFSNNRFEKRLQEFLIKTLTFFLDFLRNELILLENISKNTKLLENSYNFLCLESYYCQFFWKAAQNKPIAEFLRDRLFCTIFRLDNFLIEIHKTLVFSENDVFKGILAVLSATLKAFLTELSSLFEEYPDYFCYLSRIFKLFSGFFLFENPLDFCEFLSETFPHENILSLKQILLEKSHHKTSFKQINPNYTILFEDSLHDQRTWSSVSPDFDNLVIKRLSSKTHSNSFDKNTTSEELEALNRLSKRTSKTIGSIKGQKFENSAILTKNLTFKEIIYEEEYGFMSQLAGSYLSTQIMNTQNFKGSFSGNSGKFLDAPPETREELSIISSKLLMKSPNLPLNAVLGRVLPETCIEEALGSKIVSGIKALRNKKQEIKEIIKEIKEKEEKKPVFLTANSMNSALLKKKSSEIAEKLSQNLYTVLLSRDSSQIRDNILIAKNKKNVVKLAPNLESNDIDDFFERRRKERIINSNRESSITEEFMNKSKVEEIRLEKEKSPLLNDEKKHKEKMEKTTKNIEISFVKEKDFIKINKMTEITEKLKASLFRENASLEAFDEDIMEVSEENNTEEEEKTKRFHGKIFEDFKGKFDEKNDEFGILPGVRVFGIVRRNEMEFFRPLHSLSARRRGMYVEICESFLGNGEELVGECKEIALFYKRKKK